MELSLQLFRPYAYDHVRLHAYAHARELYLHYVNVYAYEVYFLLP